MKSLKNSVEISGLWVIGYGKLYNIFIVHCELCIVHCTLFFSKMFFYNHVVVQNCQYGNLVLVTDESMCQMGWNEQICGVAFVHEQNCFFKS